MPTLPLLYHTLMIDLPRILVHRFIICPVNLLSPIAQIVNITLFALTHLLLVVLVLVLLLLLLLFPRKLINTSRKGFHTMFLLPRYSCAYL